MFSYAIERLYKAVVEAAEIVQRNLLRRDVSAKVKLGESHHSVVTSADHKSQAHQLEQIRAWCPGARFLVEETCAGPDIITDETLGQLISQGDVYIMDALDGTAGAYRRRWDYSVCDNLIRNGKPIGGVVVAPAVRGGLHVVGERGVGVFTCENGGGLVRASVQNRSVKKATILLGVDVHRRPQFMRFVNTVANATETAVTAGSCALGVATIAIGRAEAIVQSHQWPWDWATAATLIPVAGGKVIWYHYRGGQLVQLAQPDLPAYSRNNRTDKGGLGFIAGCQDIVDWLWKTLGINWMK